MSIRKQQLKKNKQSPHDPHAEREAERYENPIPSREYILEQLKEAGSPLTHEDLCERLKLSDPESVEALRRRLIAMDRDGQLHRDRRRAYGPVDKMNLLRGTVQGHKDGFGFFIPQTGGDDLYLTFRQMQKVFDGDEVLVRPAGVGFKGKREAVIVEVLARNTSEVVGRYYKENGIKFVRPDNPRLTLDVLLPPEEPVEAEDGQYVVAEIVQQPDRKHPPVGRISQILGDHMAPGMEIDVAVRSHGIPHVWPSDVHVQTDAIGEEVPEEHKQHRVDLRHLPFVTIDGEDARDFDDAVYCETKRLGGWRLWVAIADVSSYVEPDSPLDREARKRGTSVYFPDHVVPMLPEALSNGLCSLNPEVDRLVLVCEMTVSRSGRLTGYKFYEAVIYSHARLTYNKVWQMVQERHEDGPGHLRTQYKQVVRHVDQLHALYLAMRSERDRRGAIDFETVETRIVFDQNRKIQEIVPVERNDAHKLIEECMLAANISAARFLEKHDLVGLYRVHMGPEEEKLANLREFLGELGLYLPGGKKPKPEHYQEVMAMIEGRPDAQLIQTVMLRSMKRAMYQPDNEGHFGLNYEAYTHFTSPIRRYPDLLVHRAIRSVIRSKKSSRNVKRVSGAKVIAQKHVYPYDMDAMLYLGEHCSLTERRADEATRDVVSWLKCEFLQDHVGDQFEGVVTSVTGFGLFVELKDLYVEGLIHITALPRDYYYYEQAQHRLVGEHSRQVFRLGDELLVQVAAVNLEERKVDFELIEARSKKISRISKKEAQKISESRGKKGKGGKGAGGPGSARGKRRRR
ncbi:ribonuclease R [Gilvimarinus sp. F26214L]|uniref:ribonuclease R n=1 Tax=Gilvimarinus sp. DZF01 TaxID=3461371 RepID=UPI00404578C7